MFLKMEWVGPSHHQDFLLFFVCSFEIVKDINQQPSKQVSKMGCMLWDITASQESAAGLGQVILFSIFYVVFLTGQRRKRSVGLLNVTFSLLD